MPTGESAFRSAFPLFQPCNKILICALILLRFKGGGGFGSRGGGGGFGSRGGGGGGFGGRGKKKIISFGF